MRRAFIAVVVVLSLAGCVGIPTSGGVENGPIIDEQLDPDVIVLPSSPRAGSTPEEILTDFMQAVRGPQNKYAVAREYMTTALASKWDPEAIAVIRSGTATLAQVEPGEPIQYTFSSKASVDKQGRFSEQRDSAPQTQEFEFVQVEGEWRISSAPDGIVLSSASFTVAFRETALYFFDPSHGYLVPDVRWFPARQTASVRVVQALLTGPADWLAQGVLLSAFPAATTLGPSSVVVRAGRASVDLSAEALASTPQERDWMRQQLVATLGVADAELTVGGRELPIPAPTVGALVDPRVEESALVGSGTAFGFDGGAGITPITGLSEPIVAGGATAVTLSSDRQRAVYLAGQGEVFVASTADPPLAVDTRPGLIAPSIDPLRFVWSAQGGSSASLTTFDTDGAEHVLTTGLPGDAGVVSIDVSRDGTRLLLYLATPVGPRLVVAGIVRQDNVPIKLGPLLDLPAPTSTPVDAAWVDDRSVATLSEGGQVTAFEIGGPSLDLGVAAGGTTIVGGNNGVDGLRLLTDGQVWRPQGSSEWVTTGILASFLATKQ